MFVMKIFRSEASMRRDSKKPCRAAFEAAYEPEIGAPSFPAALLMFTMCPFFLPNQRRKKKTKQNVHQKKKKKTKK
jgi:hypothetical protein